MKRRKVQQGNCWHTAWVYASEHPGAVYVEGWAVLSDSHIIEHGWCEVDGRVLDVEAVRRNDTDAWAGATYCAALRWQGDELRAAVEANGLRLPLAWGAGGGPKYRGTPAYQQAFDNAFRAAVEKRTGR